MVNKNFEFQIKVGLDGKSAIAGSKEITQQFKTLQEQVKKLEGNLNKLKAQFGQAGSAGQFQKLATASADTAKSSAVIADNLSKAAAAAASAAKGVQAVAKQPVRSRGADRPFGEGVTVPTSRQKGLLVQLQQETEKLRALQLDRLTALKAFNAGLRDQNRLLVEQQRAASGGAQSQAANAIAREKLKLETQIEQIRRTSGDKELLNQRAVLALQREKLKKAQEVASIQARVNAGQATFTRPTAPLAFSRGFVGQADRIAEAQKRLARSSNESTKGIAGLARSFIKANPVLAGFFGVASGYAVLSRLAQVAREATAAALDLGVAVAEITTLFDEQFVSAQKLEANVLALSNAYGQQSPEVARAFYQTVSAGIVDAGEAQTVLNQALKLGIAGLTQTSTAVDGLVNVINAYGLSVDEATEVSDIFLKTVFIGKTRAEELASSIGKVTPIASALGVEFEEVAAAVATLTKQGVTTAEAVTRVRSTLIALQKRAPGVRDALAKVNFEFNENTLRSQGLNVVLQKLRESYEGNEFALTKLLGRVEATSGVLGLTGKNAETFARDLEKISNAAGATERAFEKVFVTPGQQLKKLGNELFNSVSQILGDIVVFVQGVVQALQIDTIFVGLLKSIEALLGPIGALGAALVGVGRTVRGALSGALSSLNSLVRGTFAALDGGFAGFGKSAKDSATAADQLAASLGVSANEAERLLRALRGIEGLQISGGESFINFDLQDLPEDFREAIERQLGQGFDLEFDRIKFDTAGLEEFAQFPEFVEALQRTITDIDFQKAVQGGEDFADALRRSLGDSLDGLPISLNEVLVKTIRTIKETGGSLTDFNVLGVEFGRELVVSFGAEFQRGLLSEFEGTIQLFKGTDLGVTRFRVDPQDLELTEQDFQALFDEIQERAESLELISADLDDSEFVQLIEKAAAEGIQNGVRIGVERLDSGEIRLFAKEVEESFAQVQLTTTGISFIDFEQTASQAVGFAERLRDRLIESDERSQIIGRNFEDLTDAQKRVVDLQELQEKLALEVVEAQIENNGKLGEGEESYRRRAKLIDAELKKAREVVTEEEKRTRELARQARVRAKFDFRRLTREAADFAQSAAGFVINGIIAAGDAAAAKAFDEATKKAQSLADEVRDIEFEVGLIGATDTEREIAEINRRFDDLIERANKTNEEFSKVSEALGFGPAVVQSIEKIIALRDTLIGQVKDEAAEKQDLEDLDKRAADRTKELEQRKEAAKNLGEVIEQVRREELSLLGGAAAAFALENRQIIQNRDARIEAIEAARDLKEITRQEADERIRAVRELATALGLLAQEEFGASQAADELAQKQAELNRIVEEGSAIEGFGFVISDTLERLESDGALGIEVANSLVSSFSGLGEALRGNSADVDEWARNTLQGIADVILETVALRAVLGALEFAGLGAEFGLVSSAVSLAAAGGTLLAAGVVLNTAAAAFKTLGGVAGAFFEEGGVMPGRMISSAPLPTKYYAQGGIASTPQLAVFGEGSGAEAFVPLPDGRTIPVTLSSQGGGTQPMPDQSQPVTVQMTFNSLDPRTARDVISAEAQTIENIIADSLASGRNRKMVSSVRSASGSRR
jgi:TP901 family phage tail tape measure protein